jgi:hypothetical protein
MATFEQCQREYDNRVPPEDEVCECPICGAEVVIDGDGWKCSDEECGWSVYPDYDDTLEED